MEKFEETIKVNPNDIVKISKFIGRILELDKDEYLDVMENVAKKREKDGRLFSIRIIPNFLLAPMYSYSLYSSEILREVLGFKISFLDGINPDKFLPFKVLKIPNWANRKIEVAVSPDFGGRGSGVLKLWEVSLVVESESVEKDDNIDLSAYFGSQRDVEMLETYLKMFHENNGKSFFRINHFDAPSVGYAIYRIEEYIFVAINFLYTLYTGEYVGEFGKEDPQVIFLEPIVEILKGYGKTFEEVLNSVVVASTFV
jgi:hypothetical protein